MRLDAIKMQSKINRMEELYHQILKGIIQNGEINFDATEEYRSLKKEILLSLFDEPIHYTEDKYFPDVRESLQKLTLNGDPFFDHKISGNEDIDKLFTAFSDMLDIDISHEIDQLALDEFYSWFSGEEYIRQKIKGQLLILQSERLPQFLSDYVNEIRECFIFQQYIAAFVLCRTVFEIATRDLVQKKRLLKEGSENWDYVKDYVAQQLEKNNRTLEKYDPTLKIYIDLLSLVPSFENFKGDMHNLRIEGNRVVHANKTVGRLECQKMVKDTFWLIHKLYEAS